MALLPPPANAEYRGSAIAAGFLALTAVGTIVPALIHIFLPDGGAGVIAGLDLTQNGPLIVSLFAWAGVTQLVWGVWLMLVALRYRGFTPLMLALLLAERTLHAANMWVLKTGGRDHHPPETYTTLAVLPVLALMLVLSLRDRARRPV